MKIKLALIQGNIALGDVTANEKKFQELMSRSLEDNVDFIVLPELWNSGYDLNNIQELAQKEKGSSMSLLKEFAAQHSVNIVGGSVAERQAGKFYNMSPLINRRGRITEKYRKAHLFPLVLEENKYFTAGDKWGLAEADDIPIGLMLCYDLRFPEFCRNLVLRGAEIIFVPAEWPRERMKHWRSLLISRAIENQVFLVGVNRVGSDDSSSYGGGSLVVDPYGNILAEGGEDEEVIIAEIELDLITEFRKRIPALGDRMNILDEIDNSYM